MEVWILVNNRAGRQHARENGEQVRRVFALGGARARVAYTDTVEEGAAFLQQAHNAPGKEPQGPPVAVDDQVRGAVPHHAAQCAAGVDAAG